MLLVRSSLPSSWARATHHLAWAGALISSSSSLRRTWRAASRSPSWFWLHKQSKQRSDGNCETYSCNSCRFQFSLVNECRQLLHFEIIDIILRHSIKINVNNILNENFLPQLPAVDVGSAHFHSGWRHLDAFDRSHNFDGLLGSRSFWSFRLPATYRWARNNLDCCWPTSNLATSWEDPHGRELP